MDLTLINLRGSGWTTKAIEDHLKNAAKIYSQCKLKFTKIELITIDSPYGHASVRNIRYADEQIQEDKEYGGILHLTSMTPDVMGLEIYFVDSLMTNSYGTSRPKSLYYPEGTGDVEKIRSDLNTTWISISSHEDKLTVAHELAHILLDQGDHSNYKEGNILGEWQYAAAKFKKEQCSKIRKYGFRITKI